MGFCRRCGDIVSGPRCKCGGTPVAPAVQWNPTGSEEERQDRWSQTYTREKSQPRTPSRGPPEALLADSGPPFTPTKRFPRPKSATASPILGDRVSAHIAASTANRPASPLKSSTHIDDPPSPLATDILPSPYTSELSKAYGTLLQPKETLDTFTCHVCSTPFPPDATIYPDPSSPSLSADSGRFLCKPCFVTHGGSKGDCHACQRPVLILKREGGFVEASGNVYHKHCFRCEACYKNIGDNPMVDLLGRPSCIDCFDTCLNRKDNQRRQSYTPDASRAEKKAYLGGTSGGKSREGSPALEELEHRLGILRSRESSPAVQSANLYGTGRTRGYSDAQPSDGSPVPRAYNKLATQEPQTRSPSRGRGSLPSSGKPTEEAIEEMKRRFLRTSISSADTTPTKVRFSPSEPIPSKIPTPVRGVTSPNLRSKTSNPSLFESARSQQPPATNSSPPNTSKIPTARLSPRRSFDLRTATSPPTTDTERFPRTPELVSDLSDTQSSGLTTPPTFSPPARHTPRARALSSATKVPQQTPTKPRTSDVTTPTPAAPAHKTFHSKRSLENLRIPAPLSPESKCARCGIHLFTTNGGKFVTVPEEPSAVNAQPKVYHSDCFRCNVCDGMFSAGDHGQAVFVRAEGGPCHVECAPPERVKARLVNSPAPYKTNLFSSSASSAPSSSTSSYASSSSATNGRYERPQSVASASTTAFPRFGGANSCPGCFKAVSPMERGVVPGPQGTRWHATCLVCGGQESKRRSGRRDESKPGCGKKLDSAAKSDGEGGVWCRECLLLLPSATRSLSSASPSPLIGAATGGASFWSTRSGQGQTPGAGRVAQQFTGATTIARQQTGLGFVTSPSSDPAILRQLTGGGLSPTRQLGMTGLSMQHTGGTVGGVRTHTTGGGGVRTHTTGGGGVRTHTTGGGGVKSHLTGGSVVRTHATGGGPARGFVATRPKSSMGMRSTKSMDEGRGMFLVRQMTGGQASTFGESEYGL